MIRFVSGTDGPTDIAGAIIDGYTLERSKEVGVNMLEGLQKHDSSNVFRKLGDAVYTSNTGTNLMDLIVIFVRNDARDEYQTTILEFGTLLERLNLSPKLRNSMQ